MGCRVKSALPKHLRHGLPGRSERALIAVERRQDDRTARFERDAGRIGELLQRDDVGVELGDDGGNALRIVASVGADARVHVVGRDAKRGRGGRTQPNSARARWLATDGANWRIRSRVRTSAASCDEERSPRRWSISAFDSDGSSSVWRSSAPRPASATWPEQAEQRAGHVCRERNASGAAEQMNRSRRRDRREPQHEHTHHAARPSCRADRYDRRLIQRGSRGRSNRAAEPA